MPVIFRQPPGCQCCDDPCPCADPPAGVGQQVTFTIPGANNEANCSDCADIVSTAHAVPWQSNTEKNGRKVCWFSGTWFEDGTLNCASLRTIDIYFMSDDILIELFADAGVPSVEISASFLASDHTWGPTDHDCTETIDITLTSDVTFSKFGAGIDKYCTWPSTSVFTINP